jgi:hypothetical protein
MDAAYVKALLMAVALFFIPACYDQGSGSQDAGDDDACAEGQTLCGSLCVDLSTDRNHCGGCGQPCRRGEVCVAGACRPGCVDECAPYESTRCALYPPNHVETCRDSDGDGCFEWGDLSPCPAGATCEDGACSEGCPVICDEPGVRRCTIDRTGYETCGDYDGDGCLEWGGAVACAEGEECISGVCEPSATDCGDGDCGPGESCVNCPVDCGDCPVVCAPRWEWDLGPDFSSTDNPAGAWSYGWTDSIDGVGFTAGTAYDLGDMRGWVGPMTTGEGQFPAVMQNQTTLPADYGGAMYDPGEVGMVPSIFNGLAVVRWTSPFTGFCDVDAHFYAKDTGIADISVVQDAEFLEWVDLEMGEAFYSNIMDVEPGSAIQFSVGGFGSGSLYDYALGASVRMRKRTWMLGNDFFAGCNPVGQWEFGYASSTELFQSYRFQGFRETVNPYWSRSGPVSADGLQSYVWKNDSMARVDSIDPYMFALHPGCFDDPARCGEEWAVVRWVSPLEGEISIMAFFGAGGPGTPDLAIIHESGGTPTPLWFQENVFSDVSFDAGAFVSIGDTINAVVGDAFEGGDTPLDIQIEVMDMLP